jgi:hypothetical protein
LEPSCCIHSGTKGLSPLPQTEHLYSNLLKVESFAESLYLAATEYRSQRELWKKFEALQVDPGGEAVLKNKSILSFHNLEEHPWCEICDIGSIECFRVGEWAYSDDPDKQREFVELLNRSLREKLEPDIRIKRDKHGKEYYFFAPQFDEAGKLTSRELFYKSLKKGTSRSVFHVYMRKDDPSKISFCRHSAFYGRFLRFDDRWYLEITPHYRFTYDGNRETSFHESQLTRIKQKDWNANVLGQVVMWAEYLRGRPDLFTKAYPFLTFGSLVSFDINAGIDDNVWLKREEKGRANVVSSSMEELPLFGLISGSQDQAKG